jgi:hypothetical protein
MLHGTAITVPVRDNSMVNRGTADFTSKNTEKAAKTSRRKDEECGLIAFNTNRDGSHVWYIKLTREIELHSDKERGTHLVEHRKSITLEAK